MSFFWFFCLFVLYCFFIHFSFLFCLGSLGNFLGCGLISYGFILLSLWIFVLMVLARKSIFRSGYFPVFFLFVVIILTIILYCSFRRVCLPSFYIYIFFEDRFTTTLFLILSWGYQPERVQVAICLFYTLLASVWSTALPRFSKDRNDFDVGVKKS